MNKLKITLLAFLLLISNVATAQYFTPLSGPGVNVIRVFNHAGGGVTLYISGDVVNLDGCEITTRVHIKKDLPGLKHMLATATIAMTTGKKIGLHTSGCENIPFWGGGTLHPIIDNLWIFN